MADYNGWANYETWCVNLWLTNEPTTDEDLTAIVKRNEESYIKADRLQEYVASLNEEILDKAGLATDLLGNALAHVNWREIVENHENN